MNTLTNGINNPRSLVFDSLGHLWVANYRTVEEFSSTGTLLQTLSNGINNPSALVFDNQGHLWVAGYQTVQEFSMSGALLQTLSNGIHGADCLVFDKQANLWVGNDLTVEEFSVSGALLKTLSSAINDPDSLVFDSQGSLWVANNQTVKEFTDSGTLLLTLSNGINNSRGLVFDTQGNLWVANQESNTVEEFSASGLLLQVFNSGINSPSNLVFDSQGDLWVGNAYSVEEFAAVRLSHSVTYQSTQAVVIETAQHLTISPNNSINNLSVLSNIHSGDTLTIADAISFTVNPVTAANVISAGGNLNNLSGWTNGALSAKGANEPIHSIDWFMFNGNTYFLEQANRQGSAYGSGDTLIQVVGVFNENHASFIGHTLTIV